MIQGQPPNKCKAAQAREDEKKRAEERAKHVELQTRKKSGKTKETSRDAGQPASSDSKNRKRGSAISMPDISTGSRSGGGGAQKKHRTGHYDRDGFLIPEDIPLSELELVPKSACACSYFLSIRTATFCSFWLLYFWFS